MLDVISCAFLEQSYKILTFVDEVRLCRAVAPCAGIRYEKGTTTGYVDVLLFIWKCSKHRMRTRSTGGENVTVWRHDLGACYLRVA